MKRIRQLDGIRALAILAVFAHHAFQIKLLWMGVDLFFILSGFLITGVLLDAKQRRLGHYFSHFYSRRARRIVAPYLLTLIVMSLFFGLVWTRNWYWYIGAANFLQPLHIPHPAAFDPFWSLAVEEQFYLIWPFAVYFLSKRHLGMFALGLVLLAPCMRGLMHFSAHWPIYMLTPFRMDLLASGALLCVAFRNRREKIARWGTSAGLLLGGIGLVGLVALWHFGITTGGNTRIGNVMIYECTLLVCLGIMLWALSGYKVSVLCWKPLTYIGEISYTMYLIHFGVLILLASIVSQAMAGIVGFLVTVSYASISWFLLEKPLLGYSGCPTLVKPVSK